MATKIYKDIKHRTNRRVNCESANIDKAVAAAAGDVDCIQAIFARRGREYLPDDLLELAELRLQNPELSLSELGAMTEKQLTKSGVSHRMRKIREAARQLREETDGN